MNDDRNILHRRGRLELSKYWPDGTRFRRPFQNITQARTMRSRIETAIADGTWREFKAKLSLEKQEAPKKDLTVRDYIPIFLAEMRRKNRRPDFHEIQTRNIEPILGDVALKDISLADALRYRASRPANLSPSTVNRGVAVLKSMLSYAIQQNLIPKPNPLFGFEDYVELERELYIMTLSEERAFVAALLEIDVAVGAYAGIMGETALRTEEALRLRRSAVNLDAGECGIVSVPAGIAKTKKPRHIPMTPLCRELVGRLPQVAGVSELFIRERTLKPVKDTRGAFLKARERTGLDVYPESFRHFRITQWMSLGMDPRTVQQLAGHSDIHTTMRYSHFVPGHASRQILEVQRTEAVSLRQLMFAFDSGLGPKQDQSEDWLERLYALDAGK